MTETSSPATTGWPGEAEWPADLRAAMDQVSDLSSQWPDAEHRALRAALSIALSYVTKPEPERPELHVMWADESIRYPVVDFRGVSCDQLIPEGSVYLVCPVCGWTGLDLTFWQDAVETASATLDWDPPLGEGGVGEIWMDRGNWDTTGDGSGAGWLTCGGREGHALAIPSWLDFET